MVTSRNPKPASCHLSPACLYTTNLARMGPGRRSSPHGDRHRPRTCPLSARDPDPYADAVRPAAARRRAARPGPLPETGRPDRPGARRRQATQARIRSGEGPGVRCDDSGHLRQRAEQPCASDHRGSPPGRARRRARAEPRRPPGVPGESADRLPDGRRRPVRRHRRPLGSRTSCARAVRRAACRRRDAVLHPGERLDAAELSRVCPGRSRAG